MYACVAENNNVESAQSAEKQGKQEQRIGDGDGEDDQDDDDDASLAVCNGRLKRRDPRNPKSSAPLAETLIAHNHRKP
jgi:hypothetical protein